MVKLGQYFKSLNECINVNRYDNGYMVELSGRDKDDEWPTKKIICKDLDEVIDLLKQAQTLPLNT